MLYPLISEDYSTDEEYLNTIAGLEDGDSDDEEDNIRKAFRLADIDGSGSISLSEFVKLFRETTPIQGVLNDKGSGNSPLTLKRFQDLEKKVEENSKKLDRICEILEGMKSSPL